MGGAPKGALPPAAAAVAAAAAASEPAWSGHFHLRFGHVRVVVAVGHTRYIKNREKSDRMLCLKSMGSNQKTYLEPH